jgi:hypothetical protein
MSAGTILALLLFCFMPTSASSQGKPKAELFTAVAYAPSGMGGRTVNMDFRIAEYSSDAEAQQLAGVLKSQGSGALLKIVEGMAEKGRISSPASVGWRVPVVRQRPAPKGRQVILFTDRPVPIFEARNAGRSRDYNFGFVVLDLNEKDEGTGTLYMACKIRFNKSNELEVEHFAAEPVRLMAVRRIE